MGVLPSAQRTTVDAWRMGLYALLAIGEEARDFVKDLIGIDEQSLLNDGKVTFAVDWWPDKGDDWNDLRQRLIDAAEAIPEHEA